MTPQLSIAAARRLRGNSSTSHRSVPLFIDAATNCCKVGRDDDDNRTQINNNATTVRHYSCYHYGYRIPNNHYFRSTPPPPFMLNKRGYHSTSRNEILPFIAVGFLGATTVYTYRTLQQIDRDWDDYYDALDEYKAVTGIDPEKNSDISKEVDSEEE